MGDVPCILGELEADAATLAKIRRGISDYVGQTLLPALEGGDGGAGRSTAAADLAAIECGFERLKSAYAERRERLAQVQEAIQRAGPGDVPGDIPERVEAGRLSLDDTAKPSVLARQLKKIARLIEADDGASAGDVSPSLAALGGQLAELEVARNRSGEPGGATVSDGLARLEGLTARLDDAKRRAMEDLRGRIAPDSESGDRDRLARPPR